MSDPLTSWLIPAYTGAKIVSLYHNNPFVPDNEERVQDAITFYDATTAPMVRMEIVKKYRITHVLLNYNRMEENQVNRINAYYQHFKIDTTLIDNLKRMGKITLKNDDYILFSLRGIS